MIGELFSMTKRPNVHRGYAKRGTANFGYFFKTTYALIYMTFNEVRSPLKIIKELDFGRGTLEYHLDRQND